MTKKNTYETKAFITIDADSWDEAMKRLYQALAHIDTLIEHSPDIKDVRLTPYSPIFFDIWPKS